MSKIEDGGPAFPSPQCGDWSPEYGMSLRDWFAGQALAGMLSMPSDPESGNFHNNCGVPFIGTARYAYRMADAMLAARSKP